MLQAARTLLGALLLATCIGCSGQSPPANIDGGDGAGPSSGTFNPEFPYVISQDADYFATGPQQGAPADGKFTAGTKVKVRRQTGGYWLVESTEGVSGYVDSQAVDDPTARNALP